MGNESVDRTNEKLLKTIAIFKSIEQNEALKKKWLEAVLKAWRKKEVLEIAKSGGSIIGQPFRDKKGGKPYKKYRKYKVPVGWCLGVWSGATLFALMKEQDTAGIKIIKRVQGDVLEYGYRASHQYINFNIGASDKFLKEQSEIYADKVQKYIDKRLKGLMQ